MLITGKKYLRAVIRKLGYDIVREIDSPPPPRVQFNYRDLSAYRSITSFIPGMIKPEAAELLYALAVIQDIEGDILEVGSWQGKSTSYLARAVADSNNGHMYAVDHFMGNVGKENLYFVDGGCLKDNFLKNIQALNLNHVVTLFPCHSEQAYQSLSDLNIRLLFIDGDHTEDGVKKDIELFCQLVRKGGIVVFDDFDRTSPGVVLASEKWVNSQRPRSTFVYGNMLVCKI